MNAVNPGEASASFSKGMFALLDRVEYRRMKSQEDFDDVRALRSLSYHFKPLIVSAKFGDLIDDDDFADYSTVIGVYIDEKLVSTVRLHHVTADRPNGPALEYFPEIAKKILGANESYIDPSRFATDPNLSWQYPMLPFLTLRPAAMASLYFNVDYCMTCTRSDTASFYKRSFGSKEFAPAKPFPKVVVPIALLGARIVDIRERLETRFPFFKSQHWEQKMMFAPESELYFPPVNILPSARYANRPLPA